ncbi:MAG: hypothetical protein JWL80_415 [Parcubacteria group bacterium]|nr:hypothetical protein [Parcubacteria group bacterium]
MFCDRIYNQKVPVQHIENPIHCIVPLLEANVADLDLKPKELSLELPQKRPLRLKPTVDILVVGHVHGRTAEERHFDRGLRLTSGVTPTQGEVT